jgi:hypothetical protein
MFLRCFQFSSKTERKSETALVEIEKTEAADLIAC